MSPRARRPAGPAGRIAGHLGVDAVARYDGVRERWRGAARRLRLEVYVLYLVCRDPRVPWYAKMLAAGIVAYAFSPLDLIPDFIPVLGYLDDLVLIPLGVLLVRRLVPEAVLAECRLRADSAFGRDKPVTQVGAVIVIGLSGLWLVLAAGGIVLAWRLLWSTR